MIILIKNPIGQFDISPVDFYCTTLKLFQLLTPAFTNRHQFGVKLWCSFSELFSVMTASNGFIKVITWQILILLPVALKWQLYSDQSQFISLTSWFWHTCQVAYGESWLSAQVTLINVACDWLVYFLFPVCQIYRRDTFGVYVVWDVSTSIDRRPEVIPTGVMKTLNQSDTKLMKPYLSGHPLCQTSSSIWS